MLTFGKRHLDAKYLRVFRIIAFIVLLPVTLGATTIISSIFDFAWWLRIVMFCGCLTLLFSLFYWYSVHWYQSYHYNLQEAGLNINKGVFWQQQHTVPRNRVQHIDITTGPLERRYNLSKLVLHTAGTRNASVTLPGLLQDDANDLRHELINTNNTDDTV